MRNLKSALRSSLLVGTTSLTLISGVVPAHAVSWGGFSFDPNPAHPSVGVPGVKVEAHPFSGLTPVPSVHVDGNGEIAKAINGANETLQSAPTQALQDLVQPIAVVEGVMTQPLKDLGTSLTQDFQNAVNDLQKRLQQGATDAKGGILTLLIEAAIVFLGVKIVLMALGSLFRRRSRA